MADTPDNQSRPDQAPSDEEAANDPSAQPSDDQSPEEVAEQSLDSAEKAASDISRETADPVAQSGDSTTDNRANPTAVDLPDFSSGDSKSSGAGAALGILNDIDLQVKIELGRTRMYIEDVLKLNSNSIVELDKAAGDPVDIYVNDRHVARGEVLVLSENFCVRVSEIIQQEQDDEKVA